MNAKGLLHCLNLFSTFTMLLSPHTKHPGEVAFACHRIIQSRQGRPALRTNTNQLHTHKRVPRHSLMRCNSAVAELHTTDALPRQFGVANRDCCHDKPAATLAFRCGGAICTTRSITTTNAPPVLDIVTTHTSLQFTSVMFISWEGMTRASPRRRLWG